ncbi:MAG TPA: hypothetical protein PK264_10695, partial [Hyphomicrobiaceae bacterium]|nr:hypothetical protein [Hyphomicrobiaceae bacterium]
GPNPAVAWRPSRERVKPISGATRVGYEDSGDNDFNDAVTVFRVAPPSGLSVTGTRVCVPAGGLVAFMVTFSAAWENGIKIVNERSGQPVRTFNNYFGRGAGGEWNQGAGVWRTRVAGPTCFQVLGQHKTSPPNPAGAWIPSRHRTTGTRIGFEDAGDNDFNDAVVVVSPN